MRGAGCVVVGSWGHHWGQTFLIGNVVHMRGLKSNLCYEKWNKRGEYGVNFKMINDEKFSASSFSYFARIHQYSSSYHYCPIPTHPFPQSLTLSPILNSFPYPYPQISSPLYTTPEVYFSSISSTKMMDATCDPEISYY